MNEDQAMEAIREIRRYLSALEAAGPEDGMTADDAIGVIRDNVDLIVEEAGISLSEI